MVSSCCPKVTRRLVYRTYAPLPWKQTTRGPLDQCSEANAEFQDTVIFYIHQRFREETSFIQQWPEQVSGSGIIVPDCCRAHTGGKTHEYETQTGL
jgi:hypothetical protein